MGSLSSGRHPAEDAKGLTYRHPALDIRSWNKDQLAAIGNRYRLDWLYRDETVGTMEIEIQPGQLMLSDCRFGNTNLWADQSMSIDLTWTACNFGGVRPWFTCPVPGCGRRTGLLYLSGVFACRHCHKLAYRSQRQTEYQRAIDRTQRLRKKLGWPAGILTPCGNRPKGMHETTFRKLEAKHNACWLDALGHWSDRLGVLDSHLRYAVRLFGNTSVDADQNR
ncbi:hypothetical protein [Marinobacterium sp. BA1]|uniref:hypothetical protein n=1 Tax=Marinobacterium sp. BA1 TaxID=3138931 RepID=UPI0032E574FC